MSYTQAAAKFEAQQFTGDNFDTFQATVDPNNEHGMTLNDDGTCSYFVAISSFTLNPGDWLITQGYFGTFPGWAEFGGAGVVGNDQFTVQYTAI